MLNEFQWLPFLIAISVLTMSPGIDTLLVMRNSVMGGYKKGLLTSFGISSGLFVHATVSALGLSVILLGSATFFTGLKLVGALYLLYLAWQCLQNAYRSVGFSFNDGSTQQVKPHQALNRQAVSGLSSYSALRQGFLSNVLNPKPVIFYMAFLPQFIDPNYSALQQSFFMAFLHFTIAMVWQGFLSIMVYRAKRWLARPAMSRIIDTISGVLLLGFGVRLAWQEL